MTGDELQKTLLMVWQDAFSRGKQSILSGISWNDHFECRSLAWWHGFALEGKSAAVPLNNIPAYRQSQSGPHRSLRCKERLKYLFLRAFRDTFTGVPNREFDGVLNDSHQNRQDATVRHGIECVSDKIGNYLTNFPGSAGNVGNSRFQSLFTEMCCVCTLLSNKAGMESTISGTDAALRGAAPRAALLGQATCNQFRRFIYDLLQLLAWYPEPEVATRFKDPQNQYLLFRTAMLAVVGALVRNAAPESKPTRMQIRYREGLRLWLSVLSFLSRREETWVEAASEH